jgi:hypothetical protein
LGRNFEWLHHFSVFFFLCHRYQSGFKFLSGSEPSLPNEMHAHHLHSQATVLVVGQLYQDFILHVDHFPEEDAKKRANNLEIRSGGNCGNTLRVLSQFPGVSAWCMSSLGSKAEAG